MIEKIDYMVQNVVPMVYDDSLSMYELINKLVMKVNELTDLANGMYLSGTISPIGSVTPTIVGQMYTDKLTLTGYMATGLTTADWKQITNI